MPKKILTLDANTGKLSRLKEKDLPLIGATGLEPLDKHNPYGTLDSDFIEFHIYDTSDNYLDSGIIALGSGLSAALATQVEGGSVPSELDIGSHLRSLGYERGEYQIVYNFFRLWGGSYKSVLVKKSNKLIYSNLNPHWIDTNGKIYIGQNSDPDGDNYLSTDEELLVKDYKYFIQEISPSRTEIRLGPNPGISDLNYLEDFQLLGYTCISYSDISGTSYIKFSESGGDGIATITSVDEPINLDPRAADGKLVVRDAFVIDYEGQPEVLSRFDPVVETDTLSPSKNLVRNGHFGNGLYPKKYTTGYDKYNQIVNTPNPGHSSKVLRMFHAPSQPYTAFGWTFHTHDGYWTNRYPLEFTDVTPNETYIMSCWVNWSEDYDGRTNDIFHVRNYTKGGDNPGTPATKGNLIETKIVDGKTWERRWYPVTIPEDSTGRLLWHLGYRGANKNVTGSGYRQFTDIQLEPGSLIEGATPYMVTERTEDVEIPTTGLITFTDDKTITATFADNDDGFSNLMSPAGSRGTGKITIKDAIVIDESYQVNTTRTKIDDIPVKDLSEVVKSEKLVRPSPYHGGKGDNTKLEISLQCDWMFKLYHVKSDGTLVNIQASWRSNWRKSYHYVVTNFGENDRLKLVTKNISGQAGLIAKVTHVMPGGIRAVYKTGDPKVENATDRDSVNDDQTVDFPGIWTITAPEEDIGTEESKKRASHWYRSHFSPGWSFWRHIFNRRYSMFRYRHRKLYDCHWIWAKEVADDQTLEWEFQPDYDITPKIWRYPDPALFDDAVQVANSWGGFNWCSWTSSAYTTHPHWHSGWEGHHGKWIDGEGEFGDPCMKFIDKNDQFENPNHYLYSGKYKTGQFNPNESQYSANWYYQNDDAYKTLKHRHMSIATQLPYTLGSQGLEIGDEVTISWRQKADTVGKGARVGMLSKRLSDPVRWGSWGPGRPRAKGENYDTWQAEFFRYIPVDKLGDWEDASYTGKIYDDLDRSRLSRLYVYGNYGPEGTVWVENLQVAITTGSREVIITPVFDDIIGEIDVVNSRTELVLKKSYEELAPTGYIKDNSVNLGLDSTFNEFYINYTSSVSAQEPIYGSLRADIKGISDNKLTLKNTYAELGTQEEHDFNNTVDISHNTGFKKWFIQYGCDDAEDLSKLVNFGGNNLSLITNFKPDTVTYPNFPNSVVYKLYEPLPPEIEEKDWVYIIREMMPPLEETVQLVPFVEEEISDIVLRLPEQGGVASPINMGATGYKSYSQVATTGQISESIENEILSGSFLSADINVDYSRFDNFVHFSSIEKRLENFKYKLQLIEMYSDRSSSLSGNLTSSGYLQSSAGGYNLPNTTISGSSFQVRWWEQKRRDVINQFDNFDKYLYNESSSYSSQSIGIFYDNAWPKVGGSGTYTYPYVNARITESIAVSWYDRQIISASAYDRDNLNRIRGHLPTFIQDDSSNNVFLNFIDMIGHHFDNIWVYIKAITDVHDRRDKLTEGISRDLLFNVAKSLGWETSDGKDLISLPRYMFGMEQTGSETPWQFSGTSDRDISREIWSRIINNMPYFLKTKGTIRAIRGLISCYGIPSSILRVIEYGGPSLPGQQVKYDIGKKFTKAINFFGTANTTYVETEAWSTVTLGEGATNRYPDTVEFRFKATSGSNQVLVRRGTDWTIRLKDNNLPDDYGYVSFMLSGSEGYKEISSSALPVYDGDFYSVMVNRTSASGAYLSSDVPSQDVVYNLYTKKYDAGRSKIIRESSTSLIVCGSNATSQSYNGYWTGSANTITMGGPKETTYFGEYLLGSMMEFRLWTTPLNEDSFDNHVAAPIAFDGNHPSASWTDLITRYSFDDDPTGGLVSPNQFVRDTTADQSFTASAEAKNYTGITSDHFSSVVDETKMKVPNLGPANRSATKLRIEVDKLEDVEMTTPVLKSDRSIVKPAYDTAPIDSNRLGVFFSPSNAINEDIIQSMPNIDFDQYIGDPRDQYEENYRGLVTARNLYWQKYSGPNNFWDYLRLLKYYDSALYKQVEKLVPARANATVGILIEPTIFERDKVIIGKVPTFDDQYYEKTLTLVGFDSEYVSESAEYPTWETDLNYSNPFGIDYVTQKTGSSVSMSGVLPNYETDFSYSDPFGKGPYQNTGSFVTLTMEYSNYEARFSYSNPFGIHLWTNSTGSYISMSGDISGIGGDLETFGTLNMYNEFGIDRKTLETGSTIDLTSDLQYYEAPSYTFTEISSGTGSFVGKQFLERPALYKINEHDFSGWYGQDYVGSSITQGSQELIFEEVVQPMVENNKFSKTNLQVEFYYSSSLSASNHLYYSSSFFVTDVEYEWDNIHSMNRLFFGGVVMTQGDTITDFANRWDNHTSPVEVTLTNPNVMLTSDLPNYNLIVE